MPRLDISLASVELVAETPPPLRVVHLDRVEPTDWYAVVASAAEPCLLLDVHGLVGAVSASFVRLFGLGSAEQVVGRGLLEDLLDLVDFSPLAGRLGAAELQRIPPLQSLRSGGLARGLIRVRVGGVVRTVDAVTVPVQPDGSLTFFAEV